MGTGTVQADVLSLGFGVRYQVESADALMNQQVVRFDFLAIVATFDQARGVAATYVTQGNVDGMLLPSMRQNLSEFAIG
jgi:hypothetical protein